MARKILESRAEWYEQVLVIVLKSRLQNSSVQHMKLFGNCEKTEIFFT
jgi:hypothetical protein